jgi:hypothetical protein
VQRSYWPPRVRATDLRLPCNRWMRTRHAVRDGRVETPGKYQDTPGRAAGLSGACGEGDITIMELGALGEFIGAIACILPLASFRRFESLDAVK